jgi:hypothetical protein
MEAITTIFRLDFLPGTHLGQVLTKESNSSLHFSRTVYPEHLTDRKTRSSIVPSLGDKFEVNMR